MHCCASFFMQEIKRFYVYCSPIGALRVVIESGAVSCIALAPEPCAVSEPCALWAKVRDELDEYFGGKRKVFTFPIAPQGTAFQLTVWRELCNIPYGEIATYGQIAARIGMSGAARAVGMACNRNPLLLAQPCHRVVGAGGKLTGFAVGVDRKRFLLELEMDNSFGEGRDAVFVK